MKIKDLIALLSTEDQETEVVSRGEETAELAWNFEIIDAVDYFGGEVYANELAQSFNTQKVVILDFRYPWDHLSKT